MVLMSLENKVMAKDMMELERSKFSLFVGGGVFKEKMVISKKYDAFGEAFLVRELNCYFRIVL